MAPVLDDEVHKCVEIRTVNNDRKKEHMITQAEIIHFGEMQSGMLHTYGVFLPLLYFTAFSSLAGLFELVACLQLRDFD